MQGRREEALAQVYRRRELGAGHLVRAHLDDHLRSLRDDEEFRRLITSGMIKRPR